MRTISKGEWAAVILSVVVVVMFLGWRFTRSSSAIIPNQENNPQTIIMSTSTSAGDQAVAQVGDLVSVKYTGKFADGKVFDATDLHGGQPIQFVLGTGQVIKGWDQGILGMKVGEKKSLVIPPALGYGSQAVGPIPANSTLYFDVELVGIGTSTAQ